MAINISEILQKFQLRGALSAGTQILGKAAGTNADPSSYPVSLFLKALFDMLSVDPESKSLSYIDENGNVQRVDLGLSWKDFSDKEKQAIIDGMTTDAVEKLIDSLKEIQVVDFATRLFYLEAGSLRVGSQVGVDDEIDDSIWDFITSDIPQGGIGGGEVPSTFESRVRVLEATTVRIGDDVMDVPDVTL